MTSIEKFNGGYAISVPYIERIESMENRHENCCMTPSCGGSIRMLGLTDDSLLV